jgi:tetratricopeptide (TPR) repeat protein
MRSTPDPSLRGLTTDLLRSLDAQQHLRAISLPSGSKGRFGSALAHPILKPSIETDTTKDVEDMHRLAVLYHKRGNYEKAERLYQESLTIYGLTLGTRDTKVGQLLNNVARLYMETFWYAEAEPLLIRSLEIASHHYGASHTKVARRLANLAQLCVETDRDQEALEYFQKAIAIETRENNGEPEQTRGTMRACAALLRRMSRDAEAEKIERMCFRIRRSDRRIRATRRLADGMAQKNRLAGQHSAGERRRRPERRLSHPRRTEDRLARASG